MTPIVELQSIDAFYGKAHVLHQLSLTVQRGDRISLLGRNGVGKTTVVNSMLGIAETRAGTIYFQGEPVPNPIRHFAAARAGIAVVPQSRRILTNLTEVRIIDAQDNDVSPGAIGELLVRTPSLTKGYLRKPTLTADVIQSGWYR